MTVRYTAKVAMVSVLFLVTWPFALLSVIPYRISGSDSAFSSCAKLLSLVPGKIGQYLRTAFYKQTLTGCYCDLAVGFASFFAHPNAVVGRSVVIGSFSIVGMSVIEDHVLISSRVSVLSGKYQHSVGSRQDGGRRASASERFVQIRIGSGSWLGEGSIVMADVGKRCVVSAGSVVTKSMADNMTAIGNPARFIRTADPD